MILPATFVCLLTIQVCNSAWHNKHKEVIVGSEPVRPLEPQALKSIPFWGATFKFSMDVFLNTYKYEDSQGDRTWGQIVRFQSANATLEGEAGSRVPSIWARTDSGINQLHITSYIVNFADPMGPGGKGGPNNYEVNLYREKAPRTKKWFTITVSQRPFKNNTAWRFKVEVEQDGVKTSNEVNNDAPVQFNDVTIFSSKFFEDAAPGALNVEYLPADALIKNFYIWK